ncbi:MAG: glycosyltransferase family 2 protein [Coriobacteriia bacterium]|nr:glycosyltransferase family 2 protein [Coriobacteriia bacterium]
MKHEASDRSIDVAMGLGAPDDPIDVSIILPAYSEEDNIDGIYAQVVRVMEGSGYSFEILFVDDGSTDTTWDKIAALSFFDPRVRALRHRRNFGKASALANGFRYARGEIMVTSDADMQYDPNDILRLIAKVEEGYDVVSAYKVIRRDPLSKRIPSRFFNFFVRMTTGVDLHDINAGLKALRHQAAEDLIRFGYGELHRFFVVIAARRGYSVAEVPVESLYRTTGKSKYGAERYMRGALDFLTVFFLSGYSERPLHLLGGAGVTLGALGTAIFAYLGVSSIMAGVNMAGRPMFTVAALLVLTGCQLLVAGLIAEMINNLERADAGRSKIAQVLGVERRSALVLAPGVQVERRRGTGGPTPGAAVPIGPGHGGVVVERRQARRPAAAPRQAAAVVAEEPESAASPLTEQA